MLGRMRCFQLGWHRSHCRNHDCCKNKLRRCTRASACVGQVQDHVWECDTSRGPGSEMLDLAPCLDFLFLATILSSPENRQRSQPHLWVGSHHPDSSFLDLREHAGKDACKKKGPELRVIMAEQIKNDVFSSSAGKLLSKSQRVGS